MLTSGLVLGYMAVVALVGINQRKLLFFPSHDADPNSPLSPWIVEGQIIGYCHEVAHPRAVWLMAHGNAGQASQRGYVLGLFAYGIVDVPAVSHMSAFIRCKWSNTRLRVKGRQSLQRRHERRRCGGVSGLTPTLHLPYWRLGRIHRKRPSIGSSVTSWVTAAERVCFCRPVRHACERQRRTTCRFCP